MLLTRLRTYAKEGAPAATMLWRYAGRRTSSDGVRVEESEASINTFQPPVRLVKSVGARTIIKGHFKLSSHWMFHTTPDHADDRIIRDAVGTGM